jgi:iron complex transport system ATP-binding protein
MEALLKVENLSGGYNHEPIVKNISFAAKRGDFLGIIGPNGSGKSTLLRLMSRVLAPQKGMVLFENKDIQKMKLKELCQKVAFVPQDTLINFSFSSWEIVLMGRIPHLARLQSETEKDFAIAENALRLTDALSLKDKEINALSAGERQRVIVAKALTQQPILLFLDEPTSHLDIAHQIQILDLLKKLNRQTQLTIIVVLHDLNLASEYCQKLILLKEGEVFKAGSPEEVLTYQNIEAVYQTVVVVNKNPLSAKPFILLVPQERQ